MLASSFPHSTHPVHQPSLSPPLLYISIPSTSLYPNYTYSDLNHCYFIPIRTNLPAGSTLALLSSIFHIEGFSIICSAQWSDPASHSHFVLPCYSQTHRQQWTFLCPFVSKIYLRRSFVHCVSSSCSAQPPGPHMAASIVIPTSTQCYFLGEAFPDQPV